ncbi:MAG: hypothetical protein R6V27_15580 [Balneolaceae bacterium]
MKIEKLAHNLVMKYVGLIYDLNMIYDVAGNNMSLSVKLIIESTP